MAGDDADTDDRHALMYAGQENLREIAERIGAAYRALLITISPACISARKKITRERRRARGRTDRLPAFVEAIREAASFVSRLRRTTGCCWRRPKM